MTQCSYGKIFYIPYASANDIPADKFKYLHKQYWNYIADWNCREKPIITSSITGRRISISCNCFGCEYDYRMRRKSMLDGRLGMKWGMHSGRCELCPFPVFERRIYGCIGEPESHSISPYLLWRLYREPETACRIANLEWEDEDT